jgi:hypothetical protein
VKGLLVVASLLGFGCAEGQKVFPWQYARRADLPPPMVLRDQDRCEGARYPVDPVAREDLIRLEQRLIASVLGDGPCPADRASELCAMTADLHRMLRYFPDAEMVFLFPEPVKMPDTPYSAHLGQSTAALQPKKHTVFFLELSKVHMVGSAVPGALVATVFSGPTGTTPPNAIWLWGGYGERCFVPHTDGSWAQFTVGPQAVSQRTDDAGVHGRSRPSPQPARSTAALLGQANAR